MDEVRITIGLVPVTKKNSPQIARNKRTGRSFILPSQKFQTYEKDCGWFINHQIGRYIGYAVNIKCLFYMPTRRRVDLTNLLESIDDVLVKYRVIQDDNYKIVAGHDGSRVLYDPKYPRTEITITRMEEMQNEDS